MSTSRRPCTRDSASNSTWNGCSAVDRSAGRACTCGAGAGRPARASSTSATVAAPSGGTTPLRCPSTTQEDPARASASCTASSTTGRPSSSTSTRSRPWQNSTTASGRGCTQVSPSAARRGRPAAPGPDGPRPSRWPRCRNGPGRAAAAGRVPGHLGQLGGPGDPVVEETGQLGGDQALRGVDHGCGTGRHGLRRLGRHRLGHHLAGEPDDDRPHVEAEAATAAATGAALVPGGEVEDGDEEDLAQGPGVGGHGGDDQGPDVVTDDQQEGRPAAVRSGVLQRFGGQQRAVPLDQHTHGDAGDRHAEGHLGRRLLVVGVRRRGPRAVPARP